MISKSPNCRNRLAPRCRLILSWVCSKTQGYVCSTFKKVRELGLERCETVWSLSTIGVKKFKRSWASMRRMHGFIEQLIGCFYIICIKYSMLLSKCMVNLLFLGYFIN